MVQLWHRLKCPQLVFPTMELVFADFHAQWGFPVDVQYEIGFKLVLDAVANYDPMLFDVCRFKRPNECFTSCNERHTS